MTIVDAPRPVTGGVDTHLDVNVAAALDRVGGLLAVAEFPATAAGHPHPGLHDRRLAEGRSKPEVIRILKRYVAREVYRHLPRP
jgi:hypothetical protein